MDFLRKGGSVFDNGTGNYVLDNGARSYALPPVHSSSHEDGIVKKKKKKKDSIIGRGVSLKAWSGVETIFA